MRIRIDGRDINVREVTDELLSTVEDLKKAGGGVPKGTIVIWSGLADDIPFGWALCNGENGTPDLRDKFVLGAGESHPVGDEGGEEKHVLTSSEMPNHSHAQRYRASGTTTVGDFTFANRTASSTSYTATAVSTAPAGSSQAHNNMPPYYALCYIIRTAEPVEPGLEIEEYDTDDDWHVRKWSDGYVEMWFYGTVTVTGGSSGWGAFGSMYVAELSAIPLPVTILEKLSETLTPQIGSTSGLGLWSYCTGNKDGMLLTHTETWSICRPTQPSGSITVPYVIRIAGRWKELDTTGSSSGGGTSGYRIGHGLKVEDGTLSVNTVDNFSGDNTLPITAAAVQSTVGNIEILLETI